MNTLYIPIREALDFALRLLISTFAVSFFKIPIFFSIKERMNFISFAMESVQFYTIKHKANQDTCKSSAQSPHQSHNKLCHFHMTFIMQTFL